MLHLNIRAPVHELSKRRSLYLSSACTRSYLFHAITNGRGASEPLKERVGIAPTTWNVIAFKPNRIEQRQSCCCQRDFERNQQ